MRKTPKIMAYVVAALVISGGAAFGIVFATTWGTYQYSDTFYYEPSVPSPVEQISITSGVGSITINYNTTPTNHYMKIALDIRLRGGFVEGKTYSDFFKPVVWLNESTSVITFTLENKPWFLFPLSQNISIDVTLRTDVIYDIKALTGTGSLALNIPDNVVLNNTDLDTSTGSALLDSDKEVTFLGSVHVDTSTGSVAVFANNNTFTYGLKASTSTGSLTLNFTNCIMGDDLTGLVSTGSIVLRSYNMKYTEDCIWNIGTSTGGVDVFIYQYVALGANVSGAIHSSTGSVDILYKDSRASVGAKFTCSTSTGSVTYTPTGIEGFIQVGPSNDKTITSVNYDIALYTYTFSAITSTGSIGITGESAYP
ncbi:MAG: hypothetical protein ACXAEX_01875 [Promethearchaeota archaeon]|jgi:hypothetical protein